MKRTVCSRWMMVFLVASLVGAASWSHLSAQSVESKISSMEMLVGEQVAITVTAHAKDTARVDFPRSLLVPNGIEVLEAVEETPVSEGNGMMRHQVNYILTSFTDTVYPLPPIPVRISGKEYPTRQLALQVYTVDVDTTNYEKYYGPKDVQELPMSWKDDEWGKALGLSFLAVILLLVCIWLIVRLKSNKPIIAHIREVTDTPCAIGFGISNPDQAQAMASVSDGAIVGSAIVRMVEKYGRDAGPYIYDFVKSMKEGVLKA